MRLILRKLIMSLSIIAFVSTPLCFTQENEVIVHKTKPTRLVQCIHDPAYQLFQWPDQSVLDGPNRVDSDDVQVAWPKKQCFRWIQKVLNPSWLPPKDTKLIFIRREFDGRDVVRIAWERNGYNIQVSQTASIFTMKLSPVRNERTGISASQKFEKARQLCLQVFPEKGERWDHEGNKVLVNNLSMKITSNYSFRPDLFRHLKGDEAVHGRPQTMKEAGVKSPQNDADAIREKDPNNPNWDTTASSYRYWFRMINWWNDGKSVGFYFLKVEEGAWIPSYWGNIDKNFFKD
ncbi:MAG: hypothetical protein FVQ84_07685 [Planctomycetes bacterium]|nr:hypothetical protein [Planctomycetota bacterium]